MADSPLIAEAAFFVQLLGSTPNAVYEPNSIVIGGWERFFEAGLSVAANGNVTIAGGSLTVSGGASALTFTNTGLQIDDTDATHQLIISPGSNLTADRTLTVTTGDAARTLTISGDATVSQDYSTAGSPTLTGLTLTGALAEQGNGTVTGSLTFDGDALHIFDTDASHDLIITPGSNLTADRVLTLTTGDAARTVTISGDATISQDYSTAGSPQFTAITITGTGAITGALNFDADACRLADTDASHYLIVTPGSNLTANRVLTLTTGDAARTITINGDPTLNDWFDQSVKAAASPTFVALTLSGALAGATTITATSNIDFAGFDLTASDGSITCATSKGSSPGWLFTNSHASTPFGLGVQYSAASPNGTGNRFLYCDDNVATRCEIRSNGGIANFQANDVNLSDAEAKEILGDAPLALADLRKLRFVWARYKDAPHTAPDVMLTAQNVETVYPELVTEFGGRKAVREHGLVMRGLKAIQELSDRLDALKAQVGSTV